MVLSTALFDKPAFQNLVKAASFTLVLLFLLHASLPCAISEF